VKYGPYGELEMCTLLVLGRIAVLRT